MLLSICYPSSTLFLFVSIGLASQVFFHYDYLMGKYGLQNARYSLALSPYILKLTTSIPVCTYRVVMNNITTSQAEKFNISALAGLYTKDVMTLKLSSGIWLTTPDWPVQNSLCR